MARTTATNFSGALQFPYATTATDLFKKEDVQTLAIAVDQHDHTTGKGHSVNTTPANASITNAMLGPDVARANLLTNGGFEIWQRTGPFTGGYTADRWLWGSGAGGTVSITRDQSFVDLGSSSCAAVVYTHGSAVSLLYQGGNDCYSQLRSKTVTFSARVKTSVANAVRLLMSDGVTGNQWSAYHPGDNQYHTLTLTYTLASNAIQLNPAFEFGASGTFYLDNAMLVVGSQPADYAPLHPADDLARCLRYYEASNVRDAKYGVAGNQMEWWASFKAVKAITPTITFAGNASTNMAAPTAAFTNTMGSDFYGSITATGLALLSTSYTAEGNP